MKRWTHLVCAAAALLGLGSFSTVALGDGRDWSDGHILNVTSIRTAEGHQDDYMHWLATDFRKAMEAAKAAGVIVGYRVLMVDPQGPNDPDVLLVIEYKNWAAFDNLGGKMDKIFTQVEGSIEAANKSDQGRDKIRTVLGWRNEQEAILK